MNIWSSPHPYAAQARAAQRFLLQASVLALGFAMNLEAVLRAGRSGALAVGTLIAANRAETEPLRADDQFDTLFPASPELSRVDPKLITRLVDVFEAIAETAALAPAEQRPTEAVTLLTHLLSIYGVSLPQYLEALRSDDAALSAGRSPAFGCRAAPSAQSESARAE